MFMSSTARQHGLVIIIIIVACLLAYRPARSGQDYCNPEVVSKPAARNFLFEKFGETGCSGSWWT
jgi:hypothetical protein